MLGGVLDDRRDLRAAVGLLAPPALATAAVASVNLVTLAAVFLKAGALLYGSGYVLLAFLRGDLVEGLGWLTDAQLLDAVAIGQVTPGPLFTTATFIGYLLAGIPGAVVATVAIFLPARPTDNLAPHPATKPDDAAVDGAAESGPTAGSDVEIAEDALT